MVEKFREGKATKDEVLVSNEIYKDCKTGDRRAHHGRGALCDALGPGPPHPAETAYGPPVPRPLGAFPVPGGRADRGGGCSGGGG